MTRTEPKSIQPTPNERNPNYNRKRNKPATTTAKQATQELNIEFKLATI